MKPARILLLIVAVVAGGLAAFLVSRGPAPQDQSVAVAQVQAPTARVLVATVNIAMGERLSEADVQWQDWPKAALRSEYITYDALPDALQQMAGTVARVGIFAGEPVLAVKLVRTDQGYLSAVIDPGMRAVSVGVTPESAAGGFILPNDRVDIVQTRTSAGIDATSTILSNIRVLAIGQRLGEVGANSGNAEPNDPRSKMFDGPTIATLELTPAQAQTIIGAAASGELSLALRSVADFASSSDTLSLNNSRSIRLVRFGAATDVVAAGGEQLALIAPPNSSLSGKAAIAPIFSNNNSQPVQTQQSAAPNFGPEIALQ